MRFILFVYVYVVLIIAIFICTLIDDSYDDFPSTPKEIYDGGGLNMFGSCVLWLIFFILNPMIFICKFIVWIFTVGRKE